MLYLDSSDEKRIKKEIRVTPFPDKISKTLDGPSNSFCRLLALEALTTNKSMLNGMALGAGIELADLVRSPLAGPRSQHAMQ